MTAEQMRALFGCGLHPLAELRQQQLEGPDLTLHDYQDVAKLGYAVLGGWSRRVGQVWIEPAVVRGEQQLWPVRQAPRVYAAARRLDATLVRVYVLYHRDSCVIIHGSGSERRMRVGYHTITWGGVVGDATGVTSVKDLYYRTYGPMDRAIADIAAAGYSGTEMFDGNLADYEERPAELQGFLDAAGVELVSVYAGGNFIYGDILEDELDRVRRAAGLARTFGASTLVVGGGARRARGTADADYSALAAALDQVTRIAEDHGLTACYHPHLTTIVESPGELDRLMPITQIGFCPDTAHLAAGGGDPAELIRRYSDRIRHLHFKDLQLDPFTFLPLGQGVINFPEVLAAVMESGYDGWLIVELDSYPGDPLQAAKISKAYLDQLLSTKVA